MMVGCPTTGDVKFGHLVKGVCQIFQLSRTFLPSIINK